MNRRRRATGFIIAAGALAAGACSTNSADWFEPDWNEILADSGSRDTIADDAIPRPAFTDSPAPVDLAGGGPHELSVEQAVVLALSRNRDLAVAQYTPVIVGAFEQIERGVFDPEVFGQVEFAREESVETARATGSQFGVRGNDSAGVAGVRQTLPTGTDIELAATQDRSISNRAPEQQSARIGLTVTQALLRGFGPAVNLASVRQAELDTAASYFELRGFVEALLAETEIAYWQYLLAERKIEIFERSLEVARQQSEQVEDRIEVGVLAPTEAAAARSEAALREQALIDARSELEAARLQLLRRMDAPMQRTDASIVPTSSPATDGEELGAIHERIALARRLRPDLNEARLRLDQNRLETIRTRNGLLPRLDLFVALGKTGYADTFPDSFRELDGPTYDAGVGVALSHYLGNETAEGFHRAAIAGREQASAAVANLAQLVELDVSLALNDARRAREQIAATITTRELQEATAAAEQERFDVGSSTALLVAQAQRDLLAAQIAEVEAVTNYRIALVELYLAEGSLLERRGISVAR